MSQDIFRINPIFFVPIDCQEMSKNENELQNEIKMFDEPIKTKNIDKNQIEIEDKNTYDNSSSGKDSDGYVDIDEIGTKNEINEKSPGNNGKFPKKSKNDEKETIVFSTSINDPHIKSMTNSSKIYTSEIFKQNWKLKSRRLITKLKRKLIKQYNNLCNKNNDNINDDNDDTNVDDNFNNNNYSHNNDYDNNYINNDAFNCKKIFINNNNNMNNNSNNIGNNLVDNFLINLQNIPTNININFNQFNNNCQIYNNSLNNIINNNYKNELEKYKYLLYLANNGC